MLKEDMQKASTWPVIEYGYSMKNSKIRSYAAPAQMTKAL